MENDLSVALMLWAPLGLVFLSLGLQFRKDVSAQKAGRVAGLIGLGFFGVSFITVPESPSAASSALLVSVLPSLLLMSIGLYIALFAGDIPVRRFSRKMRPIGLLMFVGGFALFESMHWMSTSFLPTITWGGETNRFWMIFRPTFLLAMSSFLLAGGYVVNLVGERTNQTSRVLYLTGGLSFLLLLLSAFFDGSSTSSDEIYNAVLLAASDLLGFLAGLGLAVLAFGVAIWQFESKRPDLNKLPPPSSDQLSKAAQIVQQNLGGDEDE